MAAYRRFTTHITCRLTAKIGISSRTLRSVIECGLLWYRPELFEMFMLSNLEGYHVQMRWRWMVMRWWLTSMKVSRMSCAWRINICRKNGRRFSSSLDLCAFTHPVDGAKCIMFSGCPSVDVCILTCVSARVDTLFDLFVVDFLFVTAVLLCCQSCMISR